MTVHRCRAISSARSCGRLPGSSEVATVARLPQKVLLADVFAGISEPLLTGVVPFGLAEANVAGSPLVRRRLISPIISMRWPQARPAPV